LPSTIALQGNLDPLVLLGTKEEIKKEVDRIVKPMHGSPRYIFNLGHGVLPDTPYSHVEYLVDYVKNRL
jgi:uroporphyrinogen decarboxylase